MYQVRMTEERQREEFLHTVLEETEESQDENDPGHPAVKEDKLNSVVAARCENGVCLLNDSPSTPSFYDAADYYPDLNVFLDEDTFTNIKYELAHAVIIDDTLFAPWPERELWNRPGAAWEVIPIAGFGQHIPAIVHLFPQLANLCSSIPQIRTVFFTRLGPGTVLNLHRGWAAESPTGTSANTMLRCHLGLEVPDEEKCGVWVEGERRPHKKGQFVVFDDGKWHTVYNLSEHDQLLLVLDLVRPPTIPPGTSNLRDPAQFLEFFWRRKVQQ